MLSRFRCIAVPTPALLKALHLPVDATIAAMYPEKSQDCIVFRVHHESFDPIPPDAWQPPIIPDEFWCRDY